MNRLIDLTMPLHPGMRGVETEPKLTVEQNGWNAATWHLYSHAGTHMDAQIHFAAGPETIDQHTPARCMGPAWIVRQLSVRPRFLIAKGGITSREVSTSGLGVRRATLQGQLLPGMPVWRLSAESKFPGLDYVIFPGNVGDETALVDAVHRLQPSILS